MSDKSVSMAAAADRADSNPIYEAATQWVLRLRDPEVAPEEVIAWQAWMRQDTRHAEAFRRMEEMNEAIADLVRARIRPPLPGPRELSRDAYDGSVPIRLWQGRLDRLPHWGLIAASVLLLAGAIALWALLDFGPGRGATLISTRIGENRTVQLADGSSVTLGGNSRVMVRFDRRTRHVALIRGEAFFKVVDDSLRPFEVAAGGAELVDIGTAFDVNRATDGVMINVLEGRLAVTLNASPTEHVGVYAVRPRLSRVLVEAGEKTAVIGNGIEPVSSIADPTDVIAWISGRLAFRMRPLGEVLQEVNRYSSKPIVIIDPQVAAEKVTGTVLESDVPGWLSSLHSALGIVAVSQPDRIVLQRAQ